MSKTKEKEEETTQIEVPKCGVIMPISTIDGLSGDHWEEVRSIIYDAVEKANFQPNLVSNTDEVGIIQKSIVQNIYSNPIVICDVSGKNPNVMFELGMRLAFDKPAIIIKDDRTDYSFDTAPIEHLTYPRDLRYTAINVFKEKLKDKIIATYKAAREDKNYTTFLKHFGEFKVAEVKEEKVSVDEYVLEELKQLRVDMGALKRSFNPSVSTSSFSITQRLNESNLNAEDTRKRFEMNLTKSIKKYLATNNLSVRELYRNEAEFDKLWSYMSDTYISISKEDVFDAFIRLQSTH